MNEYTDQNAPTPASLLIRERDMFRKQFLKMQVNYENKLKELSILKELGNTLRKTVFREDGKNVFQEQIQILKKYTNLENVVLMMFNEAQNTLDVVADTDFEPGSTKTLAIRTETGPSGRALTLNEPVIVDDLRKTPDREMFREAAPESMLCLPVMYNEKPIGVLRLVHGSPRGFDQNQVRFYTMVTDQVATAVILSRLYNQMLKEENQRFILSRFFSKTVTDAILGSSGNLRLGGIRKDVCIVFADLHGFTSMSEGLDQQKVVEILNAYFSEMTPIIFQHDGTLDKLMGDGMMAIFGAPISHDDDTIRAIRTVIGMMKALEVFNRRHAKDDWPRLEVSIGVNFGEAVAGYIGSEYHLNYTVIGDAVNVAQRLQSIAGPGEILISRAVFDEISDRIVDIPGLAGLVSLPARKVKGKEKAIEVFRVKIGRFYLDHEEEI